MLKHLKKHQARSIQLLIVAILFSIILVTGIAGAWIISILKTIPNADFENLQLSIAETSIIVDSEGNFIDEVDPSVFSENIRLNQVPLHVQKAFLSIEDQSFYKHHGLDIRQIAASLIANVKSGQITRGASTITQQLVKNVYLTTEQSLSRKIKEAYITLAIEEKFSKDDILEAYLNRIDLGLGAQGIEAASQAYFSKHASELTLEEGALLAAIAKSPASYQPLKRTLATDDKSPDVVKTQQIGKASYDLSINPRAMKRKDLVLATMANAGFITRQDAETAKQIPIRFLPKDERPSPYNTFVADYISEEATEILAKTQKMKREEAEALVRKGGLHITSSIIPHLQKDLEAHYERYDDYVQRASNKGAHFVDFKTDDHGNLVDDEGNVLYYKYSNYFDSEGNLHIPKDTSTPSNHGLSFTNACFLIKPESIVLKNLYYLDQFDQLRTITGASTVFEVGEITGDRDITLTKAAMEKYATSIQEKEDEFILSADLFLLPEEGSLQPQSAAMIVDNNNGAIAALAGSNDLVNPTRLRFNHLNSPRQPGSALIPLTTYLTALTKGDTLATAYDDTPMHIDGEIWPRSDSFFGYDILARACANTREAISGKILARYGYQPILENLAHLGLFKGPNGKDGIKTSDEDAKRNDMTYDAMASGNLVDGLSLKDLVGAYSKIASSRAGENSAILEIKDRNGTILYKMSPKEVAFSKEANILLRHALRESPLSNRIKQSGYDAFSVIGTNKHHSDYFALGATPRYTCGLWMGTEIQKLSLSPNQDLAEEFYTGLIAITKDTSQWHLPDTMEIVEVSDKTGLLASHYARRANSTMNLPFLPNTAPTKMTENYTRKLICSESGDLASTYCPYETITYGYYFTRPKGYDPKAFNGILPKDYYTLPTHYCRTHTKEWHEQMLLEEEKEDDDDREQRGSSRLRQNSRDNTRSANRKRR